MRQCTQSWYRECEGYGCDFEFVLSLCRFVVLRYPLAIRVCPVVRLIHLFVAAVEVVLLHGELHADFGRARLSGEPKLVIVVVIVAAPLVAAAPAGASAHGAA
jgi:hypothetical protein